MSPTRLRPLAITAVVFFSTAVAHAAELPIGVIDGTLYGYRFDGVEEQRGKASFTFEGPSSGGLVLTYTGYDIDKDDEVAIQLNGQDIGSMRTTENLSRGDGQIALSADVLRDGSNRLVFVQKHPGYRWGVTNLKLQRDSTTLNSVRLRLDRTDEGLYGYRFSGYDLHREGAVFAFDGASEDLQLYFRSFDIDKKGEVYIELNGKRIADLKRTANDDTRDDYVLLPASEQRSGRNKLVFRPKDPGVGPRWGVTELLLTQANWCL